MVSSKNETVVLRMIYKSTLKCSNNSACGGTSSSVKRSENWSLTGSVGHGMSAKKKLNSEGDNFEPCGTPVWTIFALEFTPLQLVTDCLDLMSFDSHRQVVDPAIFDRSTLWLTVSKVVAVHKLLSPR